MFMKNLRLQIMLGKKIWTLDNPEMHLNKQPTMTLDFFMFAQIVQSLKKNKMAWCRELGRLKCDWNAGATLGLGSVLYGASKEARA